MSLIIAYVGKKGCVMASDKRRIAYFGNKENLEALESELYNGEIATDEELYKRAKDFDISIKISDDGNKIDTVGNTVMGEVASKGAFETKRRRIYGTTNGYQIIEIIGSEIVSRSAGEKAIIIFGNNFAKKEAEALISKKWKSTLSLKYMGDIFKEIIHEVSQKTPTLGDKFDVLIQQPKFTADEAQKYLNETIDQDVKVLAKIRQKLQEDLIEKSREIELASKIINEGDIGEVSSIEGNMLQVTLNDKTQAFDNNWRQLAKPKGEVIMFCDTDDVKIGDKVVIEDENLCLERNKSNLSCNIILCNL
ncbi:DUF2121 domain-containing protein [Methanobrevibacter woesei]|uniref:MJ0548 connectase family domain-containing protein n=1 Tax=Methanobrevibacter woesei TaxID=190976 RepID=UPI0032087343